MESSEKWSKFSFRNLEFAIQNTNIRQEIEEKDQELYKNKEKSMSFIENSKLLQTQLINVTDDHQALLSEKEDFELKEKELHDKMQTLHKAKLEFEEQCESLRE